MTSTGGSSLEMCSASSFDWFTPWAASAGSDAMPVGVGRLLVYVPVVGSTTQLERNCQGHEYVSPR